MPVCIGEYIAENTPVLQATQVQDYDALLVLGTQVLRQRLSQVLTKLSVIARFGVGYDKVDVEACTENGVLLTIAPDGVRRPVATSIMTFCPIAEPHAVDKGSTHPCRWMEKTHKNYRGNGVGWQNIGACWYGQHWKRGVQN